MCGKKKHDEIYFKVVSLVIILIFFSNFCSNNYLTDGEGCRRYKFNSF